MHGVISSILIVFALVLVSSARVVAQDAPPPVPPGYQSAQPQSVQPPPAGAPAAGPATQQVVVVPAYGAPAQAQPVAPVGVMPRARAVEVEHSESIRALWLPGVIALPVSWLLTWTTASTYFVGDALTYAWIPVIGPWLMLTQDLNGFEAPVVISGIVQGAATLMIVLGVTLRRTWTSTEYVVDPSISFDLAPTPGGGYGSVTVRM